MKNLSYMFLRSTLLGVVIFLLYSCAIGNIRVVRKHDNTNKNLLVYTKFIEKLSPELALGDNITIGLVDEINVPFNPNVIGRCTYVLGQGLEIDILRSAYKRMNHYSRLFLIAHEIRHCACVDVNHVVNKPKSSTECNKHYFNSSHMGNQCARVFALRYLEQIKRGCE